MMRNTNSAIYPILTKKTEKIPVYLVITGSDARIITRAVWTKKCQSVYAQTLIYKAEWF
jgi:hypothetical protein